MDIAGTDLNEILAEFESHRLGGEVEGDKYLPADAVLFREIVRGVVADQRALDPVIDNALTKGWPLKRVEALVRAVLRAGCLRTAEPQGYSGPRDRFGICRRGQCLRRSRRNRHGQCRAGHAGAQSARDDWTKDNGNPLVPVSGNQAAARATGAEHAVRRRQADRPLFQAAGDGAGRAWRSPTMPRSFAPPEGHELVLTTDAIVSGVHFLPDDPPETVARKALRVNLSDLAAKGANPAGCLLTLALPDGFR